MNPGELPQADRECCAFGANGRCQSRSPLLKRAQVGGRVWIFCCECFDVADLDVDLFYTGPFCARAKKPTPAPDDTRSVKRVSWNQKLHALSSAQVRTDDNMLGYSAFVKHQNLDRITQVMVIKLVITDAVQAHRRIWGDHEIQCGARRPAINERCREPTGRDLLVTDEIHPHESTRGVRLQF